jgi:glycine cleavage system H lipoate-binding protein
MKGRIEFKGCIHEYRCGNCEFDQYFNDQFSVHAVVHPVHVLNIKGFRIPHGFYLHPGHTWLKIEEESMVKVGLDDFALRLMGPLDRIEAPLMGKEVKQGRADIGIKRGSHHAKLLSPVSGVVTAINPKLREVSGLANQHPYTEGWVMAVQANQLRHDLKSLMIHQESSHFIKDQIDRLYQTIEDVAGPLAADGGDLHDDIFGNMPELGWDRLVKTFLHV